MKKNPPKILVKYPKITIKYPKNKKTENISKNIPKVWVFVKYEKILLQVLKNAKKISDRNY